ncbi:uncharacterized protein N7498_004481 [Penicillium cinerascens]|uniref:FAD-binding PCMH-type domain-containing protein n=1 Tax=Penicillium cinerascens TaxID=70096 RepID=A0A9W9MLY2_9EURO|nr:uncharacterized protein N7498_004481 [Penicillium cinerascens]KAJ5203602.1 hypothetical protein N7498_004481 [Penicillium cinerascens]
MKATGSFATCLLVSVGRNSSGVAFPGQPNYAALVSPYNLDLLTTPAAIVFPQNAAQVAAAVKCAVNAGIKVQAKSGGHNYGNFGSSTGELSVNLENLQDFSMDRTTWMAKFGPGNRLGQATELMYNNGGRQAPHGETFDVGLGGHATVGGAGAASRQLGLLVDFVEEVEVVLANSSIVRASKSENEDLFFAVRGAGSSVGIVTDFTIRTVPAPPVTVDYTYVWTKQNVSSQVKIFQSWQKLLAGGTLPREMSYGLTVTASSMVLSGVYFGSEDEFATLNLPSHFATPPQVSETKVYTSFFEASKALDGAVSAAGIALPSHFYAKSLVFTQKTQIPEATTQRVFNYLANTKNGTDLYALNFDGLGGAVSDFSPSEAAYPHRDTLYFMFSFARTSSNLTDTTIRFLDQLSEVLTSGNPKAYYGQYAGNVDPRETNEKALAGYYGQNLDRLKRIKRAVDPNDVFHNQQSVPVS